MRTTVFFLMILVGCAGTRGRDSPQVYRSPHGNFVVPVPAMGMFGGTTVQDQSDEDGGMVSFHDDMGNLKSITYLKLSASESAALVDPENRAAAVRGFFHEYVMPVMFLPVSPKSEILAEELIGTGTQAEYFALVKIPGGSVLEDAKTGKRLDATRAVTIFPQDGYMYMLSHASGILGDRSGSDPVSAVKGALEGFRRSIRFEGAPDANR